MTPLEKQGMHRLIARAYVEACLDLEGWPSRDKLRYWFSQGYLCADHLVSRAILLGKEHT